MKIVFGLDGDEGIPVVAITPPGGNIALQVKSTVGVGFKYYVFATIPFDFSNGLNCNFSEADTCVDDEATNKTAIMTQLESPHLSMISAV